MKTFRRAWAGVVAALAINPVVLPQRPMIEEVRAALPEVWFLQPRGIARSVAVTRSSYCRSGFAQEFAAAVGASARMEEDLTSVYEEMPLLLSRPLPVYLEDDVDGMGACAVCGKRGALGRCTACGLLTHHACLAPTLPGRQPECPCYWFRPRHRVESERRKLLRNQAFAGIVQVLAAVERGRPSMLVGYEQGVSWPD